MSIANKHTKLLDKFQKKIPKECIIKLPSTVKNSVLRNKQFKITQISAGGLLEEQLKKLDSNYSAEVVKITILNSILSDVMDTTNTIHAPMKGYKDYVAEVTYQGKIYIVKGEEVNEFDNSIDLIIDRTT